MDYHHWEGYSLSTYLRSFDATGLQGPALEFDVGAAPNLQLHLVVPWAFNEPGGGSRQSGLGDGELGFKYRFLKETEDSPQLGIFPMV